MEHFEISFFILFSSSFIYPPPITTYCPGTYNPNAPGSYACRRSSSVWTRTLDIYTRASLSECVVSMTGPPPETTQDSTPTKDSALNPRTEIKILDPAGNRTRAAGLDGRTTSRRRFILKFAY